MSGKLGRTDYAANRGPLDRREYVPRRPDPFSTCAGCLAIVVGALVVLGFILWMAHGVGLW